MKDSAPTSQTVDESSSMTENLPVTNRQIKNFSYIQKLGQAITSVGGLLTLLPGLLLWQSKEIGIGNYYDKAGQITFAVIAQLICLLCVCLLVINRKPLKRWSRVKTVTLIMSSGILCIFVMFAYVFWVRPMYLVIVPPNSRVDPDRTDTIQFIYPVQKRIKVGKLTGTIDSCSAAVRFKEIQTAVYQSTEFRFQAFTSALLLLFFYSLSFIGLITSLVLAGMALVREE